jgi:hypothetical protein
VCCILEDMKLDIPVDTWVAAALDIPDTLGY